MNIRVAILYMEAWLSGKGAVAIDGLMEDAATAEISRASVWQWIRHGVVLSSGEKVTAHKFRELLAAVVTSLREEVGSAQWEQGSFESSVKVFSDLCLSDTFETFVTLPMYEMITS